MEHDRYSKILNQNLKNIRKSKGLTAVDIAEILGVSQAKVSYIENDKGVLSARDVVVLSKKLNIPITEFFQGLDEAERDSEMKEIVTQLARFGAVLLARPSTILSKPIPFEEVFARSLAYIEDDRLRKGFQAALISYASSKEINIDKIFALIGDNPFLLKKTTEEAQLSLEAIQLLNKKKEKIGPRAKKQIQKIAETIKEVTGISASSKGRVSLDEANEVAEFVEDCLNAKR